MAEAMATRLANLANGRGSEAPRYNDAAPGSGGTAADGANPALHERR
jgi:hypothetical protein